MRKLTMIAAIALAGVAVSACRDGRPGHNSDRYGHHRDHDRDRGRDHHYR